MGIKCADFERRSRRVDSQHCLADDPLCKALAIIEQEGTAAVVADEYDRRLLGIITRKSVLDHLHTGEPLDPQSTPCKDVMVAEESTCATLYYDEETVWVMSERLGHPIPRVDRDRRFLHFTSGYRPNWYNRYESCL
jgi:CBS domain-containing protein